MEAAIKKEGPKIQPVYFCPLCHRKVQTPNYKVFSQVAFGGNLNINCGWPGCKGIVRIKGNPERDKFIRSYMDEKKMNKKQIDEFLKTNEAVKNETSGEWKMRMTREKFIDDYFYRLQLNEQEKQEFLEKQDAVECNCGEQGCEGWQMRSKEAIERDKNLTQQKSESNGTNN